MKIIYGTDFSPSTEAAGAMAAQLARRLGGTLLVAHVVDPPTVFSPEITIAEAPMMQALIEKAGASVKGAAAALEAATGAHVEHRCLVGPPAENLSDLAEREDAGLVVVGTHGRNALGRFFVGTVAERLVRRCRRPVLVVPSRRDRAPRRLRQESGGSGGERPLRLTVAIDRSAAAGAALAFARSLAASTPCEVTFVHLFSPADERERLGIEPGYDPYETEADVVAVLDRELSPLVAGFPGAPGLRIRARRGHEPDELGWAASVDDADLLVVGAAPGPRRRPAALDSIRSGLVPVISAPAEAAEIPQRARPLAPWRSVLAATDLSPGGNAAVAEAYRLLSGTGGAVELCLVQDPDLHPHAPETWVKLQRQLWKLVPAAAEQHGVTTHPLVLEGRISAEKILQAAERLGVDAIVLGVGPLSGVARALLGSVADEVALGSSRPVVMVPPPPGG